MNDLELRAAYRQILSSPGAEPAPHLPLDKMLALVEGRGSESERLATLDAVMSDAASQREFELLRALTANRATSRVPVRWLRPTLVAVAAAAVLLVALPAIRQAMAPVAPEPWRDAVQGAVLLLPEEQPTPQASRTFSWRAVDGAREYTLELLLSTGTTLFTTRTVATTVTLPDDVQLREGHEYRWWVITELADGTQLRSGFRRLRVRATR
jgi:hypothetical protein